MERITIIGLGYIGSSLGMAIRAAHGNKVEVVGYDGERRVHNQATKIGAADRAEWNLDEAVDGADLIVLAIPAYAIPEVLEAAARHLKDGATVTGHRQHEARHHRGGGGNSAIRSWFRGRQPACRRRPDWPGQCIRRHFRRFQVGHRREPRHAAGFGLRGYADGRVARRQGLFRRRA